MIILSFVNLAFKGIGCVLRNDVSLNTNIALTMTAYIVVIFAKQTGFNVTHYSP